MSKPVLLDAQSQSNHQIVNQEKQEKILCNHCLRTATNGIKCQGICVADSGYWLAVIAQLGKTKIEEGLKRQESGKR
jgi:hypothetical protein